MHAEPQETPLTGGNMAELVVRAGDTVRKPGTKSSASVQALLRHLAEAGFEGAPRGLGIDEQGRQVFEYVPGAMADKAGPMTEAELRRVGRMIRELHDLTATFVPPADAAWDVVVPADVDEVICHHDLAPWNLVLGEDDRWVFIDWDGAGPGSRLWDLGWAAHGFVPLYPWGNPATTAEQAPRLRALVDGYGLDEAQRRALPEMMVGPVRGMYELLVRGAASGEQPWARLHEEGHADHWGPAADYIEEHAEVWRAALLR